VLIFLDTNVVIYHIEQPPTWGPIATARIGSLVASGHRLAISDLVRLEARVGPLAGGDRDLLANYDEFFVTPGLLVASLSPAVCDRAAVLRATHRIRLADSLNLSAAIEAGCDRFLTNDVRLAAVDGLEVEALA